MMVNNLIFDLHLHTQFSDGDFSSLQFFNDFNIKCISPSDHNTISHFTFFRNHKYNFPILPATELTITGYIDTLFYFRLNNNFDDIEFYLQQIRDNESEIIKLCYYDFGFKNWDDDYNSIFSNDIQVKCATTRILMQIIDKYNKENYFNSFLNRNEIKLLARKARRKYLAPNQSSLFNIECIKEFLSFDSFFVLPHPIRSIFRFIDKKINFHNYVEELETILSNFMYLGGIAVEWEYFNNDFINSLPLNSTEISNLRNFISAFVRKNNLYFTIGSDAHNIFDYNDYIDWVLCQDSAILDSVNAFIKIVRRQSP